MPEPGAQQIISGYVTSAGAPAIVTSRSTVVDPGIAIYFDLQVVEEVPANPFDDPQPIDLQPGEQIRLRLTAGASGSSNQQSFRIRGDVLFDLRCVGVPASAIKIADSRLRVPRGDLEGLQREFKIVVADPCPREDVTFELRFIEGERGQKFTAATITRFVAGNENPVDQTFLQSVRVNLNTDPPEQVAILHIEAPSADKYRMKGWNRKVDSLAIEFPRPTEKIGLADFVEGSVSPDDVRSIIKSVSRRASQPLMTWFQQLYRKHGERLCLIIADHTDAEIPWEMLEFESGKNLGAACILVRWIPVLNTTAWKELAVAEQRSSGGVIAHLDYQELKHTAVEQHVLTQLKADFRDSENLRLRLEQPLQNIGLVYLASHGIFSYDNKYKAAVGSLANPSGRLSAVLLENLEQPGGARPIFFVNACHSARLMHDDYGLFGLPEVILARLASGYIGTLGPVGQAYAPTVGEQILKRALNSETGINPAEELRRIRAEAVQRLETQSTPENLLNFVFAFMYVYYGNPLACLQLTADGGKEPEE